MKIDLLVIDLAAGKHWCEVVRLERHQAPVEEIRRRSANAVRADRNRAAPDGGPPLPKRQP